MNGFLILLVIIILIGISAFFSGSEIALANANRIRLKKAAENGSRAAAAADKLGEDFTRSISAILIGNDLVNIAATSAATVLAVSALGESGEAVAAVIMTAALLLFSEILPKIIAAEYADMLVKIVAFPLRTVIKILGPAVNGVTWLVNKISFIWTPKESAPAVTPEELCTMVEEIEEEGVLTERESELIISAIEFTDVTAREIMTPRVDVVAFDIEDGAEAIIVSEELLRHSYFPVYRETLDNIVGVMSSRKMIKSAVSGCDVEMEKLLKPAVFVHMTRTISSILRELRKARSQMAVVVDEFGGTMGILTREDIIEEIVGEIYDEKDEADEEVKDAGGGSFVVDGGLNIYDMFELVGYEPRDFSSEYTTVGGWATEILDRFPKDGDVFNYDRLTVTVLEAQSMRVEKLLITLKEEDDEADKNKDREKDNDKDKDKEEDPNLFIRFNEIISNNENGRPR